MDNKICITEQEYYELRFKARYHSPMTKRDRIVMDWLLSPESDESHEKVFKEFLE